MNERSPFPSASLLPHAGRARFVDQILESGTDGMVCEGQIPSDSPFARDGEVPGFVLVELVAQAAAIDTLAQLGDGALRPTIGYLVRARELNWTASAVPTARPLTVSVQRSDSMPPLYVYRATATLEGTVVFGGSFSIYLDYESL